MTNLSIGENDKISTKYFEYLGFEHSKGAYVKEGYGSIEFKDGWYYCENNKAIKKLRTNKDLNDIYLHINVGPEKDLNPIIELAGLVQKQYGKSIETKVLSKTGADHIPEIKVEIKLPDGRKFEATGKNKRLAKRAAAQIALDNFVDEVKPKNEFLFGDVVRSKCSGIGRYIGNGKCVFISAMGNSRTVDDVDYNGDHENRYDLPTIDDKELMKYRN